LLALSACATLPPNHTVSATTASLPREWRGSPVNSTAHSDVAGWWNGFADPQLRSLIEAGLAHNYHLRAAIERVREARGSRMVARSALFPNVNVEALAAKERAHFPPPVYTAREAAAGLGGSWTIDVFGDNQLAALAAVAQAQASLEARRDFEVALSAQIATVYMSLRGAQRERVILAENIGVRADTLQLTQARYQAGLATDLDVARAQTQLEQAQALLPDVQRQIDNDLGTLAILIGNPPESIDASLLAGDAPPPPPPPVPVLAPALLLERRPDIRKAVRQIDTAAAELGSARADRLPKFTLSFSRTRDRLALGRAPAVTDNLFNLGLGVFWPLFDAGRIRADIEAHGAALRESEYSFDQALLNALQDVETAYTNVRELKERTGRLAAAVDSARRASTLAQSLYEADEADFLSVLDAHRELLDSERDSVGAQTDLAVNAVILYRALGGGRQESESAAAPRTPLSQHGV
jgi:NodT family efflux transporter outer membrane factor (OMF) lipoprotein